MGFGDRIDSRLVGDEALKRVRLLWGIVAVCGLLGGVLLFRDRPPAVDPVQHANRVLSAIKLPGLPEDVTDVQCWAGGMFAKFVNVKFAASEDQAVDFLRKTGAACYLEFQIDGTQARVLATHPLTDAYEKISDTDLHCLTRKTGMFSKPWFKSVYDIRHGWHYHRFSQQEAPVSLSVFYDLDSRQLYIYWSYS